MKDKESNDMLGFILWLIWIAIVVLVLGSAIYLFIAGSSLFNNVNSAPVVLYRQIDKDKAMVSVRGSINIPTKCNRLELNTSGDIKEKFLNFTVKKVSDCEYDSVDKIPETFFTEFNGDNYTHIRIFVDGTEKNVIVK